MKDYIVALSPIDSEPVMFDPKDEQILMSQGWAILPNGTSYSEELDLWEKQLEHMSVRF